MKPYWKPASREQVYDEQIHPLMEQILALCRAHDLPFVMAFDLDDDAEEILCVGGFTPPSTSPAIARIARIARSALARDRPRGSPRRSRAALPTKSANRGDA